MSDVINPLWSQYSNKYIYPYASAEYRSGTSGDPASVGGPAPAPEFGTGAQVEALIAVYYPSSYDITKLDDYVVNSFNINFIVGSNGLAADVEAVILPLSWYNMTNENKYNAIKSAVLLAKTGTAKSASAEVNVSISDIDAMRAILTRGIGWRKTSSTLSNIAAPIAIIIDYGDAIFPATLAIVSPKNTVVVGNNDITLTWSVTDNATPQTHYDVQYSNDSGETWTTLAEKVESADTSYTVTGGTFASGNYLWRVRIYGNSGTELTNWAQAAFTVINNASTTGVTCDNKPMPTITWTASEQIAYQVKMGDYDSGTVYSATGSHRPAKYFTDGTYVLTVRTQTALGVWSSWTTALYVGITNVSGDEILLSTYQGSYGAGLSWITSGTYTDYYILRDGISIAVTTGNTYTDAYANGTHVYTVLAPLAGGYYTISNESTQTVSLPWDMISAVDTLSWLPLKHALNNLLSRSYSESDTVSYRYYAGREYPVAFRAGQKAKKASLRYGFKTADEVEEIYSLVGAIVIFKDRRGNRVIGMIDGFSRTVGKYYDISMSITQIDYNEEVLYDTEYPES